MNLYTIYKINKDGGAVRVWSRAEGLTPPDALEKVHGFWSFTRADPDALFMVVHEDGIGALYRLQPPTGYKAIRVEL